MQLGGPPKTLRSRRRHERHDANVPDVAVEVGPKRIGMRRECGVLTDRTATGEERDKEKDRRRKAEDGRSVPAREVHPAYSIETVSSAGVIAEARETRPIEPVGVNR